MRSTDLPTFRGDRCARATRRLRRRLAIAFLTLAIPAAAGFCDPLIGSAQAAQKAGDAVLASRTYRAWLRANPGAPGSARVFSAYFAVESDLSALLVESSAFLVSARGCPGSGEQFRRIARLFDLAGRIEESRDAYLAAWSEDSSDSSLVAAAFLSLEMNDTAALAKILADSDGGPVEPLAAALSPGTGRDALAALAAQSGDPDLALKARWLLSRLALARGDAPASAAELGRLASRFAASPEAVLANVGSSRSPAAGRQVVLAASAYAVLSSASPFPAAPGPPDAAGSAVALAPAPGDAPGQAPLPAVTGSAAPVPVSPAPGAPASAAAQGDTTAPSDAQAPALKGSYAVQAGSFKVKENADDLSAELLKKGFSPAIVQDLFQGKDRFRVFAGAALGLDQAKAVLGLLTAAGYSGFVIAAP